MKKAAVLAFFAALLTGAFTPAESAQYWSRTHRAGHYYAPHRTVYWVYRSPRYIPPPAAPAFYFFACCPTNRVNIHMY